MFFVLNALEIGWLWVIYECGRDNVRQNGGLGEGEVSMDVRLLLATGGSDETQRD